MAKRSAFKRVHNDYYRTWDGRAVAPLMAHVRAGTRFREPFAGDGSLMINLVAAGLELDDACDIEPRGFGVRLGDAFDLRPPRPGVIHISNSPWRRDILHRAIVHLSDQAPTWLLFDAGWAYGAQAAPFKPRLRKVVAVGRLRWIFPSRHDGTEDCAWYLFDRPFTYNSPRFYLRGAA